MSGKIFHLASTLFFLWIFECIQISNADVSCNYFKANDSTVYQKLCPVLCCPNALANENTTCCYITGPHLSLSTTPGISVIGYKFWIYLLCAVCLFTALYILFHYVNRIHSLKHIKYFNSAVDPVLAFTISKNDLDVKSNDPSNVFEQTPPSYTNCISPPPPYVSIIYEEKKLSE